MTNPEPIVIPTPSRPARIAALHAAGLFLAEHIDLPMPATVHMHAHNLTWAQLTAVADLHQATIEYGTETAWCNIPVTLETLHGIEIEYTAFSRDLPQTTPMDLPPRDPNTKPCTCTRPSDNYIPETHEPICDWRDSVTANKICICGMADGLTRGEVCPACGSTVRADEQPMTTPMDLPPRVGVVLPEQDTDPWEDVMPATPRPRCEARWEGARCVHPAGHSHLVPHFYDDDETNGAHGA